MKQKQIDPAPTGGTPGDGSGGGNPAALKAKKKDLGSLLAAGDNAIKKALSGNSQAFLEANRQQGGQ